MDSFAIFNRFMQHAASSRFKWIADVQTALYNMDTNLVDTLLSISPQAAGRQVIDSDVILTDYQEADTLIKNYRSYYTAYLQYLKKQTLDTNELERLAAKCPAKDGAAVYLARSLYALISGLYTSYDDDNCMNTHSQFRFTWPTSSEQDQKTYSLYPNPNEGSFIIQNASLINKAQDDKTIMIRVYNAVGAMVYGMNTGFRYGKINVAMGQKPAGTYIVCIFDGSEKTTCLPFVIK